MKNMCRKILTFLTLALLVSTVIAGPENPRPTGKALTKEVARLVSLLTLDEKLSLIHANSKFTVAGVDRLGIKEMTLSDGPHGIREEIARHSWDSAGLDNDFSTYLPVLTAVAASWDPKMASLHGGVLGREARHRNKDIVLGPGVNLARLPTYGRNFEYLGEDPYLASVMVVPQIQAIQEEDVAACVKHYALNTQELNRQTVNAQPDDRTLREVYLPAFEAAVKQGKVKSVMGAYNQYFGTNANQSKKLVKDILKDEWGFEGVMLTDWNVYINTFDAAMHGLDLEMGTSVAKYSDYFFADPLKKLVLDGKIPIAIVDQKVSRILNMQIQIGMMDNARAKGKRNTPSHRKIAQKIAEEGVVLLKNKNLFLPLNKNKLKKVLVVGPNATKKHGRSGGSSQVKSDYEVTPLEGLRAALGDSVEIIAMESEGNASQVIPSEVITTRSTEGTPAWRLTYFETEHKKVALNSSDVESSKMRWPAGTEKKFLNLSADIVVPSTGLYRFKLTSSSAWVHLTIAGEVIFSADTFGNTLEKKVHLVAGQKTPISLSYNGNQYFSLGFDNPAQVSAQDDAFLAQAKSADAVIYFGGLSHTDDRESGDRADMKLPGGQNSTITSLIKANKNTIVFLIGGSAVEMPWVNKVDNILWGWYGGMEAGHAYARVLLGDVNPGGKMPITLPVALEDSAPIALNDYNGKEAFFKEGVFIGHRWFELKGIEPLFPFGHGLSYTDFRYSKLTAPKIFHTKQDEISVSVTVKNTGRVMGAEVLQLYLGDPKASVDRPKKELKGFQKVELQPGEKRTVEFTLTKRDLSFWSVKKNDWLAEPGKFKLYIGSSSADIRLTGSFMYKD